MNNYKEWRRTKGDAENYVGKDGKVYAHIVKHRNEGWRVFVGNAPLIDRATRKPKNFKDVKKAKYAAEITLRGV